MSKIKGVSFRSPVHFAAIPHSEWEAEGGRDHGFEVTERGTSLVFTSGKFPEDEIVVPEGNIAYVSRTRTVVDVKKPPLGKPRQAVEA